MFSLVCVCDSIHRRSGGEWVLLELEHLPADQELLIHNFPRSRTVELFPVPRPKTVGLSPPKQELLTCTPPRPRTVETIPDQTFDPEGRGRALVRSPPTRRMSCFTKGFGQWKTRTFVGKCDHASLIQCFNADFVT